MDDPIAAAVQVTPATPGANPFGAPALTSPQIPAGGYQNQMPGGGFPQVCKLGVI